MEQRDYVYRLLQAYRTTPGTCGAVRRPDRLLAAQLHQRGVPIEAVENALTLAAARRLARPADAPPLAIIRSLAYFSPVIEEVLALPRSPELLPLSAPAHCNPYIPPVASILAAAFTPAAWMMLTVLFFDLQPTCAPTARMMIRHTPAISALFSVRVTLTNHYWVTSDERRRSRAS
jgi:hypothetical protein